MKAPRLPAVPFNCGVYWGGAEDAVRYLPLPVVSASLLRLRSKETVI